jgi:hypothetical protein
MRPPWLMTMPRVLMMVTLARTVQAHVPSKVGLASPVSYHLPMLVTVSRSKMKQS